MRLIVANGCLGSICQSEADGLHVPRSCLYNKLRCALEDVALQKVCSAMRGSYVGSADQTGNPFQIVDLSEHPEYARRVGEIVSLWAMIELRLSIVFGMLLRAPPWQAWEAFFAINNAKARIDMLRALAVALDDRIPEKSELLDLLKRAQDAPAARHGYAHRPWVEYKGQLYQMDMPAIPIEDSGKHHVSTRTMDADISSLKKLSDDLMKFQGRFGNKYLLMLESSARSDSPDPWPGKWPGRNPRRKS